MCGAYRVETAQERSLTEVVLVGIAAQRWSYGLSTISFAVFCVWTWNPIVGGPSSIWMQWDHILLEATCSLHGSLAHCRGVQRLCSTARLSLFCRPIVSTPQLCFLSYDVAPAVTALLCWWFLGTQRTKHHTVLWGQNWGRWERSTLAPSLSPSPIARCLCRNIMKFLTQMTHSNPTLSL